MAVLTNLGEKMSDDEVDELLKAVDTSSGEINYYGEFLPSIATNNNIHNTDIIPQTSSRPFSPTKPLSYISNPLLFTTHTDYGA